MNADRLLSLWQYPIPQHLISRLMGLVANSQNPAIRDPFVKWFAQRYGVNMAEAANPDLASYRTFNEFFTRPLKAGARPVDADAKSIVSPADGAISELGPISDDAIMQAKGWSYSARTLLGGDENLAASFRDGLFMTVYLSPKDYHRVHLPLAGTLRETIYVPGRLFSVNTRTANGVPGLFARNERVVCIFDTVAGPMAVVLVGAIIVAGIATVWQGTVTPPHRRLEVTSFGSGRAPVSMQKGDEIGRFLVGSTAIVLLPKDVARWRDDLRAGSPLRMGERIGTLR
ncbi:MAG: archaetidylserine decarboxylase [Gammaproteobacteria bacterium]